MPATDAPPTLARCLARHRAPPTEPPDEVDRGRPARAALGRRRPQPRRSSRPPATWWCSSTPTSRSTPTRSRRIRAAFEDRPGLAAVFGSYDDAPERAARRVGRSATSSTTTSTTTGAGPADTFWTGLGAVRREATSSPPAASTRIRYPHPSIEDIELGERLAADGARDPPRPDDPGHAPEALDAALDGVDRLRPPRRPLGRAAACANRRLSSSLNCGWRHRAERAGVAGRAWSRASLGRPAGRRGRARRLVVAQPRLLRAPPPPHGPAGAVAGVALHVAPPPRRRRGGAGGRRCRPRPGSATAPRHASSAPSRSEAALTRASAARRPRRLRSSGRGRATCPRSRAVRGVAPRRRRRSRPDPPRAAWPPTPARRRRRGPRRHPPRSSSGSPWTPSSSPRPRPPTSRWHRLRPRPASPRWWRSPPHPTRRARPCSPPSGRRPGSASTAASTPAPGRPRHAPGDGPARAAPRDPLPAASWRAHAVHDDALADLGPHLVDWARWLTGGEVADVRATRATERRHVAHPDARTGRATRGRRPARAP